MTIVLGALAGILGFLPIFAALRLSRRHVSQGTLSLGLFGLGGACVSLIVLVVATVACGMLARQGIVGFVVAEAITFLGSTIAYVLFKMKFGEIR